MYVSVFRREPHIRLPYREAVSKVTHEIFTHFILIESEFYNDLFRVYSVTSDYICVCVCVRSRSLIVKLLRHQIVKNINPKFNSVVRLADRVSSSS